MDATALSNAGREEQMTKTMQMICVLLVLVSGMTVTQAKPKWQVLFDGTSLTEWRGFRRDTFPAKCWVIEEQSIKTVKGCDKADQVDIITKQPYQNFVFEFEWRVSPGANSGLIYLISEVEDQTWKTGPEMQLLDDDKHPDGKKPTTSAGSLFDLIAPTNKKLQPVGQYNSARLIVNRGHVEHWLNGKKVLEYHLRSAALKELIAQSKFKSFPHFAQNSEGFIALQFHGDDVWFRKIRIRAL